MNTKTPVDLPEGYLDFYKNLESWQNQQQIKLKQAYTPAAIDVVKIMDQTKRSVMQSIDFELDASVFREVYLELLKFLQESRPETADQIEQIRSASIQFDFEVLPVKIMEGDRPYFASLAQKHELAEELLVFSVDHTLRPFLGGAAPIAPLFPKQDSTRTLPLFARFVPPNPISAGCGQRTAGVLCFAIIVSRNGRRATSVAFIAETVTLTASLS